MTNDEQTAGTTAKQYYDDKSIAMGLRACAREASSYRDAAALRRLARHLEAGMSLEAVMGNDRYVPLYLQKMVLAGVQSGHLELVLEQFLNSFRKSRQIRSKVLVSLIYPATAFCIAIVILSLFTIAVIPQFKSIFNDFGVELPAVTIMFIRFFDVLYFGWPFILLVILSFPLLLWLHRIAPGRVERSALIQRIPFVGRARHFAGCSEFCSKLAVLVNCRLPLDDALRCLATSLTDPVMAQYSENLAKRLENGAESQDLAHPTSRISPALSNVFRWARDPETFAAGLNATGDMFAAQAEFRTGQLLIFIEPMAMLAIAIGASFSVTSMLMPLIRLLNDLS